MAPKQQQELLETAIAGFPEIARSLTAISTVHTRGVEELQILQAAIAGIPRVAQALAVIPPKQRTPAFAAAERGYLHSFHDLGFVDAAAQRWAAIIVRRLRAKVANQEATTETIRAASAPSIHEVVNF